MNKTLGLDIKLFSLMAIIFLSLLSFFYVAKKAEAGWFDKGIEILQTVKKDTGQNVPLDNLTGDEIGRAFKDALRIGSENVVGKLGSVDGFNADPEIHIPLPDELNTVRNTLSKVGMSSMLDDLELKLNRTAENATPKAKKLFGQAIADMTFEDVNKVYNGPEDSATQYFKGEMAIPLAEEMQPIIEESLLDVGAVNAYDQVMGQYHGLPFVPDIKSDLTKHVIDKCIDGVFHYLAKEEAAIRQNPVRQTTDILKRVFGGN